MAFGLCLPAQGALLVWDANPEPTVVGYRVYRGGASRNYTNVTTVAAPSAVISDLVGRAGFMPIFLAPVNFELMYQEQRAQQAQAGEQVAAS